MTGHDGTSRPKPNDQLSDNRGGANEDIDGLEGTAAVLPGPDHRALSVLRDEALKYDDGVPPSCHR